MGDDRPNWDEYFMGFAKQAAKRGTCIRPGRKVGCVITFDRKVIATGYNGAPTGAPHCDEIGCLRDTMAIPSGERAELCRGLHAEQNAILQAAEHGVSIRGGTMYLTHSPCSICAKMIINSGVKLVIFDQFYPDKLAAQIAQESGWKWGSIGSGGVMGTVERIMERGWKL